jgi:ribosomal protein L24E
MPGAFEVNNDEFTFFWISEKVYSLYLRERHPSSEKN